MSIVHQQKTRELFTADNHGSYAVLKFGPHLEQQVIDLKQTEQLWRFFETLRESRTKTLLAIVPDGTFATATVDRFWEHIRQAATENIGSYTSTSMKYEFDHATNAFRRFMELVREVNSYVIMSLQGEVDFRFLGLALACDYRIAADDVVFVNRFFDGEIAAGILPRALSRIVGHTKATNILLERKTLSAKEAYDLGLVNRLAYPNNLAAASLSLAQRLSAKPTGALVALKKSMDCWSKDLASYLDHAGLELDGAALNKLYN